jgi:CheY-like chemotaxis protein
VNARDALTGQGTIRISARAEAISEQDAVLKDGRYVCLAVADDGHGMDAETLKRATEPFFTTKGVGKGTGLGLSMVQGLAEQSGGKLIVKSELGVGTTAEIWLPAATEMADVNTAPPPLPSEIPVFERQLSVIAVDDDPLVLANMVDMLEDLGHSVTPVGSGKHALDVLQQKKCDLLVTDHAMPQMTGTQLIERVRVLRPDMRVILATGYAELPGQAASNVTRLGKPFTQADLAKALAKAQE